MIVKFPDDVLRQKCNQVKKVDKHLLNVINKLKSSLKNSSNGIGLAAPQVGEDLSVFVIHHPGHDHIHDYINPQIIDTSNKEKVYPQVYTHEGDREEFYEGCLSFPEIYGTVKRWMEIKVKYQVVNKKNELQTKEEKLTGLMAIIFQHELDHLNGVLFVDRIKENGGHLFKEANGELREVDIEKVIAD